MNMNKCICNVEKEIIYKGMKVIDIIGEDCNGSICNNGDIGKDCNDIITNFIEDLSEDDIGDNIEVGLCSYCNEVDCLYVYSGEKNKNMCFECFEEVKKERGWFILEDGDDLEECENNLISCCEFMNDMEYTWNDCKDKWVCCSEMSWCKSCETSRDSDMVIYCYKCDNGYCCDYDYVEFLGENYCRCCLEDCIETCNEEDKCSGCGDNCLSINEEYDIETYRIEDRLICKECL